MAQFDVALKIAHFFDIIKLGQTSLFRERHDRFLVSQYTTHYQTFRSEQMKEQNEI